jgi:hypothetical protein
MNTNKRGVCVPSRSTSSAASMQYKSIKNLQNRSIINQNRAQFTFGQR